jgi:hypothetical protein
VGGISSMILGVEGGWTSIKQCKSVNGNLCSGGNMIAYRMKKWLWSLVNAVNVGGWQRICKRLGNHVKKRMVQRLELMVSILLFALGNRIKISPFINKENANE